MDDLKTAPASACFLLLPVPTFAQVMRPSSRRTPSVSGTSMQGISTSTCTHKKRGAPDCCFVGSFPSLRFWQAGAWQLVKGASTSLRQDTSEPNPRLCDQPFDFQVTASLLGKIATAFCRDGQPERPRDLICLGNRSISAAQAPSNSAHLVARLAQFHMPRFATCIMPVFGVVSFAASGALRSAAVAS